MWQSPKPENIFITFIIKTMLFDYGFTFKYVQNIL